MYIYLVTVHTSYILSSNCTLWSSGFTLCIRAHIILGPVCLYTYVHQNTCKRECTGRKSSESFAQSGKRFINNVIVLVASEMTIGKVLILIFLVSTAPLPESITMYSQYFKRNTRPVVTTTGTLMM